MSNTKRTISIEHTDTFAGEANYCWVREHKVECGESRVAIVRAAKKATGLTGCPATVTDFGDLIEIRPRGICQVVFVKVWSENPVATEAVAGFLGNEEAGA